jgi:hypothetical protein
MFAILVNGQPWVANKDYAELQSLAKEMQPCISKSVSVTRWRSTMRCKHPNLKAARFSFESWAYNWTDGDDKDYERPYAL